MEYFKNISIAEGLTEIDDLCGTKMYLVEGNRKAALIDTGIGLGNIYKYVKTLTDKPLVVIITHGHLDHAMGSGTFPDDVEMYMSELDHGIYENHSCLSQRYEYYESMKILFGGIKCLFKKADKLEWYTPASVEQIKNMKPHDTFDLGDEILEICSGAGHTSGCITVLLRNHRILLTGDAANNGTYLFDDYSLGISEYKKAMLELDGQTDGKYERVLVCHGSPGNKSGFADVNMVKGAIYLCDAILENRDLRIKTRRMGKNCFMAKKFMSKKDIGDKSECNIIYSDITLH